MEPWIRDLIVGVVVLIAVGYMKYVLADVKGDIAENKKDIEDNGECIEKNVTGISDAKKELYEHTEKTYYSKETMDAKILALKYRGDRGGDPSQTI